MQAVESAPFRVTGQSDDILNNGPPWSTEDDITTNYERKFHEQDLPVYCLELERI